MYHRLSFALFVFASLLAQNMSAQSDTLHQVLEDIVVTATKTKRQLSSVTVPVTLISHQAISQLNANRLEDVLGEYTGLATSAGPFGAGIQLQGLDPDYTLIMVDGIPLIGRLNGVLDLSRLSVSNIAQIEVVKGPSSALFGSSALAGVVNIITKKPTNDKQLTASSKISSFQTYDFSAQAGLQKGFYKGQLSANYYTTEGYNITSNYKGYKVSTESYGKTVSPHHNYAINLHNDFQLSSKINFLLDGRYFKEKETYHFADADTNLISGNGMIQDYAVTPSLIFRLSPKIKSTFKATHNQFKTETTEQFSNLETYSENLYHEKYTLAEIQNDWAISKNHEVNIGIGYEKESLKTTRISSDKTFDADNKFIYAQYIYSRGKKANFVVGARYENHKNYTPQFNPRASLRYKITPKITLKASIGRGFKKPTFKQLFFNYTNRAVGYSVFGAKYLKAGIQKLLQDNEIAIDPVSGEPIIYDAYQEIINNNGKLNAESSIGLNIGFQVKTFKNTLIDISAFRNDLKNLIDYTTIAVKNYGRVFSYVNKNRVFTQGAEVDIKYFINKNIKLSIGYQYLIAKDKEVIDEIKAGKVFAKDISSGVSYRITEKQYKGLFDRSNHSGNFKIFISNFWQQTSANVRVIYKGRFGYDDLNGNQVLDIDQEYVPGYFMVNTSIQKAFFDNKMMIQLGIDNVLNYTYATPEYTISTLPGRIFFTSLSYRFFD